MKPIETQEDVEERLAGLAAAFKGRSLTTAPAWRQVPLLAVVANGRSGWSGAWSEAAEGLYPFSSAGGGGLRIRCTDGMPMVWSREIAVAEDAYILHTAASSGYELGSWDGNAVLERLVQHARGKISSFYKAEETHAQWKHTIAQHEVGLVAGWQEETGVLHAVSEVFVRMASSWEGSVGGLLTTSIGVVGAGADPEIQGLAIHRTHLEY